MAKKRQAISKKTRFEVFKRDKFTCQYCGKSAPEVILEVDHIKPVYEGGKNDIMNLVTSCRDCNRGKGKRKLDDNSVIAKQTKQLRELADKNEQLEMMLKWREEMSLIEDKELQIFLDTLEKEMNCYLSEDGEKKIKSGIKKYGLQEILDSFDIALEKYYHGVNPKQNVLRYTLKIAEVRKKSKDDPCVYWKNYLAKVFKDYFPYTDKKLLYIAIDGALENEEDFVEIRKLIRTCDDWEDLKDSIENHKIYKEMVRDSDRARLHITSKEKS